MTTAATTSDLVLGTRQGRYNLECIYSFIEDCTSLLNTNNERTVYVFDTSPTESALLILYASADFKGEVVLQNGEVLPFSVDSVHLNNRLTSVLNEAQNI